MKKRTTNGLISVRELDREKMPHYYDYAIVIDRIQQYLFEKTGHTYKVYGSEEAFEENNRAMAHMLEKESAEIEIVTSVFEQIHNKKIYQTGHGDYSISHSEDNNLIFFKESQVAYTNIVIYQSHADYPLEFLFAPNDEAILEFSNQMLEKERTLMMHGITVLTDTEDGLEREEEKITYQIQRKDVLLDDSVKTEIYRGIDEFFTADGQFFKMYDIPYKRGILLYGSPGNGKTTLVKSIAGSVEAPVIYWQITEFTSSYSIYEVFQIAKKMAPVILIIEDIDSMPHESRSVFLNALDGATSKEGIFLIGTTNYPEKIDPALINRAGRFDRAYEFKQPDELMRRKYLSDKNINQFVSEDLMDSIVKQTRSLSISQLNELYMSMALEWHYEQQVDVEKVIKALKENHRKTMKQDWDSDDYEQTLGF